MGQCFDHFFLSKPHLFGQVLGFIANEWMLGFKLCLYISIVCFTGKFWEVVCQVGCCDLLFEQVCFVEEEDEGGFLEELAAGDHLEQGFALLHSIL